MSDPIPTLIAGLVAEADRAILNGWLAALRDRYARESRPMVMMCGCADWMDCAHPWPMMYYPPTFEDVLANLTPVAYLRTDA